MGGPFLTAQQVPLETILPWREAYLRELNAQSRYHACHERGWTDSYGLTVNGQAAGYGSVKGQELKDRDTIFEWYVAPAHRAFANPLFRELLIASKAVWLEGQTNDPFMAPMLEAFAEQVESDVVLFADDHATRFVMTGAVVRSKRPTDKMFPHHLEPEGDYVLEQNGEIVATGGFFLHYNHPFADLYMEVREDRRRRGWGSYVLQEVKQACYQAGRVPAARCAATNQASQATILKAGLKECGRMVKGRVKHGAIPSGR